MTLSELVSQAHHEVREVPVDHRNTATVISLVDAGMAVIRQDLMQASRLATHGLRLSRRLKDSYCIGIANRLMGHTHLLAGRAKQALPFYHRARAAFVNRPEERAGTAVAMLQALAYVGDYPMAFEVGEEALVHFQDVGDKFRAARVSANLGNALHRLDRLSEARSYFERALPELESAGATADLAIVTRNYGVCLMGLMELETAATLYAEARATFAAANQTSLVYEIDLNRAYLLGRQGRIREALLLYRNLRDTLPEDLGFELGHCFLDQADLLLENGLWTDACQASDQAYAIFSRLSASFEMGKARLIGAMALTRRSQLDEAILVLRESRRLLRRELNENWRALVDLGFAEWYRARGMNRRALNSLLAAERANLVPERRPLVERELADLCLDLGVTDTYNRLPERAPLAAKAARLAGDFDSAARHAREGLRQYDAARQQLEGSRLRQATAQANERNLRECFRSFTDPADRFDAVVRLKSQRIAELALSPESIPETGTVEAFREAQNLALSKFRAPERPVLRPGQEFIELFADQGQVMAFVLKPKGIREVRLGTVEDWSRLGRKLRFQLGRERGEAGRGATELLKEIANRFGPALADANQITIGRDLALGAIPIHAALPSYRIAYTPNAATLAAVQRRAVDASGALVIGVADENAPLIAEEAQLVARHLGCTEGVPADFETSAPTARYVHLAAHGLAREDQPLLSSMKFGASDLTVMQILRLRLNAELVTLSGCCTGISAAADIQEAEGFIEAFLISGANAVVASLYDVADEATLYFMDQFYRELPHGHSSAFWSAQQATKERYPHPADWAAFALFGQSEKTLLD